MCSLHRPSLLGTTVLPTAVSPSVSSPPRPSPPSQIPRHARSSTLHCLKFLRPSWPRPSTSEGGQQMASSAQCFPSRCGAAQTPPSGHTPHRAAPFGQCGMRSGHLAIAPGGDSAEGPCLLYSTSCHRPSVRPDAPLCPLLLPAPPSTGLAPTILLYYAAWNPPTDGAEAQRHSNTFSTIC